MCGTIIALFFAYYAENGALNKMAVNIWLFSFFFCCSTYCILLYHDGNKLNLTLKYTSFISLLQGLF